MANISTINGIAEDNIASWNGTAATSITSVNLNTWITGISHEHTHSAFSGATSQNSYTFSSVDIGSDEQDDRLIVIAVTTSNQGKLVVQGSGTTINSVQATLIVATKEAADQTTNWIAATVPSGTSVTVVIDVENGAFSCGIDVYSVLGATLTDVLSGGTTHTGSQSGLVLAVEIADIPAGSLIMGAIAHNFGTGVSNVWTGGLTADDEDIDGYYGGGSPGNGRFRSTGAAKSGGGTITTTSTLTGTVNHVSMSVIALASA